MLDTYGKELEDLQTALSEGVVNSVDISLKHKEICDNIILLCNELEYPGIETSPTEINRWALSSWKQISSEYHSNYSLLQSIFEDLQKKVSKDFYCKSVIILYYIILYLQTLSLKIVFKSHYIHNKLVIYFFHKD